MPINQMKLQVKRKFGDEYFFEETICYLIFVSDILHNLPILSNDAPSELGRKGSNVREP